MNEVSGVSDATAINLSSEKDDWNEWKRDEKSDESWHRLPSHSRDNSYFDHNLFHLLGQPQTSVIILAYFSTVFHPAHSSLNVRIWRFLPCGRRKKHTLPLKITESIAPAVSSTVVKFQVGKICPRRPTSPLLGHFRP